MRDKRILREKSTLSNHAIKSHKMVLITLKENNCIDFTMCQALFQPLDNLFNPSSNSVKYFSHNLQVEKRGPREAK